MEATMDMTSNSSNNTGVASTPHNQQQEILVSSPAKRGKAANNTKNKKPRVAQQAGGSEEPKPYPVQDAGLRCLCCSSKNTKFCYYNNYNLNQPRYFCKACCRYWTQGGSLRLIPIGGSCRRNKRASAASSSSSDTSSTAATSAEVENTVTTQLMLTVTTTTPIMSSMLHSPTTGLLFPNAILPTFTPTGGSGGLGLTMDDQQQGFLPFKPLSLSCDQVPDELAPRGSDMKSTFTVDEQQGFLPLEPLALYENQIPEELAFDGSDMTPTFLEMKTGGYFEDNFPRHPTYNDSLVMSDGSNGMDMSFLLPEIGMGSPVTNLMVEGMDDVAGELKWEWASLELDNYFNNNGGYATGPGAGVELQQQQVVGDQQQQNADEDDNKTKESSKNTNENSGSSELSYNYWINNTNNIDGGEE